MNQQNQVTAAQQIAHLNKQLTDALLRKQTAEDQLEQAKREVIAIRNVLTGVQVGAQLQRDADAEKSRLTTPAE